MKVWTCICGCMMFTLIRTESMDVDFSEEGAIEGHPHIGKRRMGTASLVCTRCHTEVPNMAAVEMLKEII